jgi:hypothetical protein
MAKQVPPRAEAAFAAWSTPFSAQLTATPAAFSISPAQASTYAGLHSAFIAAYEVTKDNSTRTPGSIVTKRAAQKSADDYARMLIGIIQKSPTTSDTQRTDLGINVPRARSPINPPTIIPTLDVLKRYGTSVEIRIHDGSESRGKPAGVAGASVYSFVGPVCPTDPAMFKSEGITTRMQTTIDFDPTLPPGTVVWITACFYSPRGQTGTACQPVSTVLAGGAMSLAA